MKLLKFGVFSKKHDFFHGFRKTGLKMVSEKCQIWRPEIRGDFVRRVEIPKKRVKMSYFRNLFLDDFPCDYMSYRVWFSGSSKTVQNENSIRSCFRVWKLFSVHRQSFAFSPWAWNHRRDHTCPKVCFLKSSLRGKCLKSLKIMQKNRNFWIQVIDLCLSKKLFNSQDFFYFLYFLCDSG